MLQIFQEAALPKLSETSLFMKFDETSDISNKIKNEIKKSAQYVVSPESLKEIIALMRLNGDAIVRKAIDEYMAGKIVVIFNKTTSDIPPALPFIVVGKNNPVAYIFADKFMNNISSTSEYTSLMAVMEAAYLARLLYTRPEAFLMNAPLMLTLCNIYTLMAAAPLEQKLYMKGDNLNKAMLYIITYFYRMIRGGDITITSLPYKRIMLEKIDENVVNSIIDDVLANSDNSFMGLLKLIQKINPIRYKDLDAMYMSYFTSTCGIPIIFALENISYVFLLVTSAEYKTQITGYGLNKTVSMPCKKAISLLTSLVNS